MATTSLWHIKGQLCDLIDYVENPDKTSLNDGLKDFVNVFLYDTNPIKTNNKQIKITPVTQEFIKIMKKKGYIVNVNPERKYATIRSVNDNRNTRLKILGEKYDWSSIVEQINTQDGIALFPAFKEFNRASKTKYVKAKIILSKARLQQSKKLQA